MSDTRTKIEGLLSLGTIKPARIAVLCEVTRSYVYQIEAKRTGKPKRDPKRLKRIQIEKLLRKGIPQSEVAKRCDAARSHVCQVNRGLVIRKRIRDMCE